jgi:hypothetical protein
MALSSGNHEHDGRLVSHKLFGRMAQMVRERFEAVNRVNPIEPV